MSYFKELLVEEQAAVKQFEYEQEQIRLALTGSRCPSRAEVIYRLNEIRRKEGNYGIWNERDAVRSEDREMSGKE